MASRTDVGALLGAAARAHREAAAALEQAGKLLSPDAGDLVPHAAIPVPRRVSCAACAAGEVDGARKVGRRWLATRAAWNQWIDQVSAAGAARQVDDLAAIRALGRRAH